MYILSRVLLSAESTRRGSYRAYILFSLIPVCCRATIEGMLAARPEATWSIRPTNRS